MAAALFLGWPVRAITVWPITIARGEHGCCWRWDFRQGPGGDVDVLYPEHRPSAAAYVWLYGAGPLTNALLMAVGLGAIRIAATHTTRTLALMLMVLTNFIVGFYALWPRGTRPFTDGDMLLAALAYWLRDRRPAPIDRMDTGALPIKTPAIPEQLRTGTPDGSD